MKYLGPTRHARLNEAAAVVFLFAGLFVFISLASYHPFDPSLNTASGVGQPVNLTGRTGAFLADFFLQALGLAAYSIPALLVMLGWKWLRSTPIGSAWVKVPGVAILVGATCTGLGLLPDWRPIEALIPAGGLVGSVLAAALVASMNTTGAVLVTAACWVLSLYLVSTFEMSRLAVWFRTPLGWWRNMAARLQAWREERARQAKLRAQARQL